MTTLIIAEKPSAALRIATALADEKPTKKTFKKVAYYELTHKNEKITVACAVGHLYTIAEKEKKGWRYPVFEVDWKASYEKKASAFTKPYLENITNLASKANKFIIATDFDIEGSVMGLNIIRYACNKKDAQRMKFSTLTKDELVDSYENASKSLDWGQAIAGETRHILDWIWGINLSRALTLALKTAGAFKILTTGRVQGPTLDLIYQKEQEISKFKSEPYWEIEAVTNKLKAMHKKGKFKEKPTQIINKIKNKNAIVKELIKRAIKIFPPAPFDLTTLQIEAYRFLGMSPKETLANAQTLYTSGYISYPRTSSQKLPPAINYKKIISALLKQAVYAKRCATLLTTRLIPHEGKKSDSAHPAIYPTGIMPSRASARVRRLYDLITSRFLATFSTPAETESTSVLLEINKEPFIAKGSIIKNSGWYDFYQYARAKEIELPDLKGGEEIKVKKINLHEKETQPPKRYTPASLIKELEKQTLGTKATRAQIIDSLYQRNFIRDKSIQITILGESIVKTLKKYSPEVLDESLTRHFEQEMEELREGKKEQASVIKEAQVLLTKTFSEFKNKEKSIGKELLKSHLTAREEETSLGPCLKCKEGTLQIRRGKFGLFVACNKYPECKTTFSLPSNALVKPTKKICEKCNYPKILVIKRRKRPQEVCIYPKCSTKLEGYSKKQIKEMESIESGKLKKICPKCKKGNLKVRKSVYGSFIACDQYPKCRYVEETKKSKS